MSSRPIVILLAEDNPGDRRFTSLMLEESGLEVDLRHVEDGQQLMDYLHHRGAYNDPATAPHPGLILLDLHMPRKDGREALEEIKADPRLQAIPIVVLTGSEEDNDKWQSFDLRVSHYLVKPVDAKVLPELIRDFGFYWQSIQHNA
ncbi:MAG: response regulator [Abitibacteriaceae bacterium]|nr:response regulator [Abditibacteriaceae bacterium]MBV9865790.1 response regulator [Abditibacteriaceae bacterium]